MRSRLMVVSTLLTFAASAAGAMDLLEVWRAALEHDLELSAADAGHQAGESRRRQGKSLWRPTIQLTGTAGRMSSESETTGAQFSEPGFPQTDGVSFNPSVNNGALGRWMVEARQPLISRERLARSRQLELSADIADLEWQGARQTTDAHYGAELLRSLRSRANRCASCSNRRSPSSGELGEARTATSWVTYR